MEPIFFWVDERGEGNQGGRCNRERRRRKKESKIITRGVRGCMFMIFFRDSASFFLKLFCVCVCAVCSVREKERKT